MPRKPITLSAAIEKGRLRDFVAQQEAAGVAPVDAGEFDALLSKAIKQPRSEHQTSRSRRGGSSA